jgi:hypothetical protein
MFKRFNESFSMPFHITSRIRFGGDTGIEDSWGVGGSTASKNPKKPKVRKKLKDILMRLSKTKNPLEILGIPTRITLKKRLNNSAR